MNEAAAEFWAMCSGTFFATLLHLHHPPANSQTNSNLEAVSKQYKEILSENVM